MDPRRNECAVMALDELRAAGYDPRHEFRGKHAAIIWAHDGAERMHTIPLTPSDWRSIQNNRAQLRKTIREDAARETNVVQFVPRVVAAGGNAVANTRDVAEAFGKQHGHVLRDVDKLLKDIDSPILESALFRENYAADGQGIDRRTFDMTRDGFALLAMGFTGPKALRFKLQFIEAFNTMESALARVRAETEGAFAASQIAALQGDLSALTDLVLEAKPVTVVKKGQFIRPSVLRKLRRAS